MERNKKAHRESFLSGNPISFLSLYHKEDAQREISDEILGHLHKLLPRLTSTKIEIISHAPGTGGTTVARRVLWDLHKSYPCAIANISSLSNISFLEFGEESSVRELTELAEKIGYLDDLCESPPVILLDGKSSVTLPLADQLARKLNTDGKKAILLCCTGIGTLDHNKWRGKGSFVHCSHKINVELEESRSDLQEFKKRFEKYASEIDLKDACRVFHFPLLAMQTEYHPKLRKIITESLDFLQNKEGYEYEVIVLVAFLLIYTELPTPALLIYEVFQKHFRKKEDLEQGLTYSDIKDEFSDTFLNLMISKTASYKAARNQPGQTFEAFTLQHHLVAKYALEHAQRPLRSIVEDLLDRKEIFQIQELRPLFGELFIYHRGIKQSKFSLLIDDLKDEESPEITGNLFCKVSEETQDPIFFSNAARFYSYQHPDPDFIKAENLIKKALDVKNISKDRRKGVYDTYGTILRVKLKYYKRVNEITSIDGLEIFAKPAIEQFRAARDNFHTPKEFPNPLIGEIRVWLTCFDWIITNECNSDNELALQFITNESPEFFRASISTCYRLLNFVDEIVQTAQYIPGDSSKTKRLANDCRFSLLQTFGTQKNPQSQRPAAVQSVDIIEICKHFCTRENFKGASSKELKRLQVYYIIEQATKIELLSDSERVYLMQLLRELVIIEEDYSCGRKLLQGGSLDSDASLQLDESLKFIRKWADKFDSQMNPYIMYYRYMICFCKILEGDVFQYRPEYDNALKECRKRSDTNCRRTSSQYFLREGDTEKMSQLITKTEVEMEYKKTTDDRNQKVQLDAEFWKKDAAKYLRKCTGKIYVQPSGKPYIELTSGKLKIYVPERNVGRVNRDFELGDKCSFFIGFSLCGPRACGLRKKQ